MLSTVGGRYYWARNEPSEEEAQGIVVIFSWSSVTDSDLDDYVALFSSLGWNSLVCVADFLNLFLPERATALAFAILNGIIEELRVRPCPLVFAAFSGGSKACLYKVYQVIEGACEAQLSLDDTRLVRNCICGHIYDSGPVDFTSDPSALSLLHPAIRRIPGSTKLASWFGKGLTTGLDALFLTSFGSHRTDYWQTLCSSVNFGAPFLILCSENDDLAPYPAISRFAHRLEELGGSVKLVKWNSSPHLGHYKHDPFQYRIVVSMHLEQALSVYSQKIRQLGQRSSMEGMPDQISELICELQNVAVNSNESFGRVARGPNDHFFLPSSVENSKTGEHGDLQKEPKEEPYRCSNPPSMSAHSVLGHFLFDKCVAKNIEGWDIKFSGSLNGNPIGSSQRRSPLAAMKRLRHARL